jgi:hypothetical protein
MANPIFSTAYRGQDGRLWIDVTEAKTLAAEDSGIVQNVIYASGVITLPAVATQGCWTIRNGGVPVTSGPDGTGDDGNLVSVDPNGSDTVAGLNVEGTEADGKKLNNTAATALVGDEVTIINTGATDGGIVVSTQGIWARES